MVFFILTSEKSTVGIYWNNAAETWIDIRSTTADKVIRQSSYKTKSLIFLSKNEGMLLCGWSVGRPVGCQYREIHYSKVCHWYIQSLTMTHRWWLLNYRAKVTWFTNIYVKFCLTNIPSVKYLTVIRLHTNAGLNHMVSNVKGHKTWTFTNLKYH